MDDADGTMDDFKIELFIFPDGTAVEMMVFDQPACGHGAAPAVSPSRCAVGHAPEPAAPVTDGPVHVCPVCRGDLVHPVEWQRTGDSTWSLRLRCPECESERSVVLGRPEVEQLNRELYLGTQELAREAQRFSRQNFEDEARRFIAALHRDQIQPIDF